LTQNYLKTISVKDPFSLQQKELSRVELTLGRAFFDFPQAEGVMNHYPSKKIY